MGKDHDLLEAARNGHISVVEKILNQKAKRIGPLASLRRGPGANIQDSSGYSGLHHAALNGHIDIVRLLLAHDASPNLPDTRGSSPLHLAAWAGHQEIVKLFLTAHRPANPNLQTIENETPLHCAAQYGHTGALTTLLAHGADPNVTNCRKETPLDLAAQYGRLQAVQMLIRAHPEMLLPYKANNNHSSLSSTSSKSVVRHSPLHLASRNGHKNVVEVLLAAGVNVNLLTSSGTALHEAALCGKDSVVRLLLDSGADLDLTDCEGRTALDILEEFPPHVTKGIVSVINNHRNLLTYDSESDDHHIHNKNHNNDIPMSLGSSYENNRGSPVNNYCSQQQRIFDTQINDITTSPSSSMGSLGPPSPKLPEFYISMAPIKQRLAAPKKPPRRNLSVSPTHPQQIGSYPMSMSVDGYSNLNKSAPYEYICLAHTGQKKEEKINRSCSIDQYVEMTAPRKPNNSNVNTTLKSYDPNRKLKRNRDNYETFSIDFNKDRDATTKIFSITSPQSPTNYEQPPTPEHPPPSATQAEKVILERIRPLSQEYKRRSGLHQSIMIECGTSPQEALCSPSLYASNGSISSSVSISDRSVSTDCVEEFVGDIPFAGLFKGSTMALNNPYSGKIYANCGNYLTKQYNSLHNQESSAIPCKDSKHNDHFQQQQHQDPVEIVANSSSPAGGQQIVTFEKNSGKNKRSLSFGGVLDDNTTIEYDFNIDDNYYKRCNENGTSAITNRRSHIDVIDSSSQYDDEKKFRINRYFNRLRDTNSSTTINSDDVVNNRKPGLGINQRTNSEEILSPFNEEEAWAKISEIMESFGSGILNSNDNIGQNQKDLPVLPFNRALSDAGHKLNENYAQLCELLVKNNLTHLEGVLIENGFDNIKYLNGILDETDMIAMNINSEDRQKLLNVIHNLPTAQCLPVLPNSNNNCLLNVDQWLHSIQLTEYIEIFKKHLYTNMEGVCRVWEVELQTVLEINKIGHRKRILYSVSTNRKESTTGNCGQATIKELNSELIKNKEDYEINGKIEINTNGSARSNDGATGKMTNTNVPATNIFRHSNKKNRPAPQPPTRIPTLEIRAPSELLLGLPSNLQTKWRHSANALVNGSIKYEVFYLGSTIVKELRGTESTRKSIQKLKRDDRSTLSITPTTISAKIQQELPQAHHQKQPVRLAISQRGVEFFDVEKNETICEHEIRNINCACQDADDLSHFAYLTKDATMNAHYCHVFNVDSMDLATEIILTLGQAFEVAYQMALRNASSPKIPLRCSVISTNAASK